MHMPDWLRFPLVLTVVGLISAASLAGLNSFTAPKRAEEKANETKQALDWVIPEAAKFEKRETPQFPYFVALDDNGTVIGYAAEGSTGGYGGEIHVVVGVDRSFKVLGIKVLSQRETPGLGDKVEEVKSKKTWGTVIAGTSPDESGLKPWFQDQFKGVQAPARLKRDGGTIEAITGATISSKATVEAVNSAVEKLRLTVK